MLHDHAGKPIRDRRRETLEFLSLRHRVCGITQLNKLISAEVREALAFVCDRRSRTRDYLIS
jgi:hypothetical protein